MKQCKSCGQVLSEKILTCPACGSQIVEGIKYIDDYKILAIIHEGRSSIVCKAIKDSGKTPVSIRLFTEKSGVDDSIAKRLEKELKELKSYLPNTLSSIMPLKKVMRVCGTGSVNGWMRRIGVPSLCQTY